MDPLSVTASIIAILQLTVKVGEAVSSAKDASSDRTRFATDITNFSKLLVDLLARFDESSDELWHTKVKELGRKGGLLYQYGLELKRLEDKISDGQGVKKLTRLLLWRYIKEDVERILSSVARLHSLVQTALELDHFTLSEAIKKLVSSLNKDTQTLQVDIDAVHKDTKTIKMGIDAIQLDQDCKAHRLIMDWLSTNDFSAQQADFIERRQEDTGLWFLNSTEFENWVRGTGQTLFCPGIPGAGKTMMAAIAIDHLRNTVQASDVGVAYLYCNYKRQEEQTTRRLLAAILKQLVQDQPSMPKPLANLYGEHEYRKTTPSLQEITTVLRSVLADYTKVYVVIDALDECPSDGTGRQLLERCRDLQQHIDLCLMATSRDIPLITDEFKGSPRLEVQASNADVRRYVVGQIDRLPRCVQRDGDVQEFVQIKVAEAVEGMFLLARLHVDSLADKRTKFKVISALNNLSRGSGALNAAYDEAIIRIDAQQKSDRKLAKSTLSWISHARRPLNIGELCHALAVKEGDEDLDLDDISEVEDILSVCAGLVTVDEESQIIRLVHYTTQDYLEAIRETWIPNA